MTTNKLVRLEDVLAICNEILDDLSTNTVQSIEKSSLQMEPMRETYRKVQYLPTYPEPTKWSNHALLQEYIDKEDVMTSWYTIEILKEIQSRLTEWTEYEIGKEYEFSDDWEEWETGEFYGYCMNTPTWRVQRNHIRPIQVSQEEQKAIELLKSLNYKITK
jgi:hypothetical protein